MIAENGAGQHGVATGHGLRAARPGVRRLHGRGRHPAARRSTWPRMKLLGAEVIPGPPPAPRTLKDAINEALRDWVSSVDNTHYLPRHRRRARTRSRRWSGTSSGSSRNAWKMPIALLAADAGGHGVGQPPGALEHLLARLHSPTTRWKSLTIVGNGGGPATEPSR